MVSTTVEGRAQLMVKLKWLALQMANSTGSEMASMTLSESGSVRSLGLLRGHEKALEMGHLLASEKAKWLVAVLDAMLAFQLEG